MIQEKIKKYLIHSYIYYVLNDSVISDYEYDDLCEYLLDNYRDIEALGYDTLIDRDLLECGSGYSLVYPDWVEAEAKETLQLHQDLRESFNL